ncbi:hypothetical protein KDK77_08665 [bacterium]|nr:hypothetical protein [bacterium]
MFDSYFFYYIKKNIEKFVFFALFSCMCILLILLILNLPHFKVSLFEQKISKRASASVIQRVDVQAYVDLQQVLLTPTDYLKIYTRDPFSPIPEQKNEFDSDEDGLPNEWEKMYGLNPFDANDAYADKDSDMFSNFDEFTAGTDPADPLSKPEEYNPLRRFRLLNIYKKPLELLFDGYMQLPDGSFSFVINSGMATHFKRMGETIDGYKIINFKKRLSETNRMGVELKTDESELYLSDENGELLMLVFHRITTKKELWVTISDLDQNTNLELREGDHFGQFTIQSISEQGIIVTDTENTQFDLKYERRNR